MALSADGSRLFVSRLISPDQQGEIWDVATAGTMRLTRTIPLAFDPGPDSDNSGRGVPNYLTGIAITPSPKGYRAWVVSKKDNIGRGVVRDGNDLTFENTVRTILSSIDVTGNQEVLNERVDFDTADSAVAVLPSPPRPSLSEGSKAGGSRNP
jgi:hypothetical protein